jgi:hypothetical protein
VEKAMWRHKIGQVIAPIILAALAAANAGPEAMAKSKNVSGDYDCGCRGGEGSCTFKTHEAGMTCIKDEGDTCNGTCRLITSTSGISDSVVKGTKSTTTTTTEGAAQ